ncbi:MAG: cytochrome c [Chitinophagales bacterium]|nr:cytochrome c [Chitinophagales bacterium]
MKRNLLIALSFASFLFYVACSNETKSTSTETTEPVAEEAAPVADETPYDPTRGEGKYDESNLTLGALDKALADKGKAISNTKCTSCHKMSDERLVGPGWKGVTERRTPHWLMNFITNPDPMIDKDPEVQSQLEICLVRMPDQNLTDDDARGILEYMRENDGVK